MPLFSYCSKKVIFIKQLFFSKIILNFSNKIDHITLDPDPNWDKSHDPDPNSMYLDPQRWSHTRKKTKK